MRVHAITVTVLALTLASVDAGATVKVVTTTQDYAAIARELGGERVEVEGIVPGCSDPHFIKPKPSYALMLKDADLLVSTGLDLELWLPVLVNKAGNRKLLEGTAGYVSAGQGVELLEKPVSLSRSAGDVHVYGNPHIHTSPLNARLIARNIATGLCKVDPDGCPTYESNLRRFQDRLSEKLYGQELLEILDAATLDPLAARGALVPFLEQQGLAEKLGGWLGQARGLHGQKIITYHKNWPYLAALLGVEVVAQVEPKPGIPPSARHVAELIDLIAAEKVSVLMSANYFERSKPEAIAERTGITLVVVPLSVGGEPGVDTYEALVDLWISRLCAVSDRQVGANHAGGRHRWRHGHEGPADAGGGER
jgi:ABC-type Zn uptake system ZnuABC Zn-binding protein ZnuA